MTVAKTTGRFPGGKKKEVERNDQQTVAGFGHTDSKSTMHHAMQRNKKRNFSNDT